MLVSMALAQAEPARRVMHDGIAMAMSRTTAGIEISYIEVPADLRELGVKSGAVLVRGQWDDTVLIGDAFMFARDCAPIAYPIRGVVDRSGALVIIGPQPQSCGSSALVWSDASVMRFEPPALPPVREREAKPKPKPKPKPEVRPIERKPPRPAPQQAPQWQQWRWF